MTFLTEHTNLKFSKRKAFAFTMAELLIALTIIGVLTAIILPTIQDKISKKQWELHKKALYSRMTQAIALLPTVKGYGEYTVTQDENGSDVVTDTAAMAFVTEGLSKVYKMNNICDNTEFKKCGLPDKIFTFDDRNISFPDTMHKLTNNTSARNNMINSKAVAYETANGDSVAVFYNPNCETYGKASSGNIMPSICANFIYDLNGLTGPNRVGQDIGAFTLVLRDGLELLPFNLNGFTMFRDWPWQTAATCRGKGLRWGNHDELSALIFNFVLVSSNTAGIEYIYNQAATATSRYFYGINSNGARSYGVRSSSQPYVFCVKP